MAKADQSSELRSFQDNVVLDADVHVMTPPEVQKSKAEKMEPPWRNLLDPDTSGNLPIGPYPSSGLAVEIPGEWEGVVHVEDSGLADPDKDVRQQLCQEFGIDHPIINMGANGVSTVPEPERRLQEMRATNDVLVEHFLDGNPDFFGVATVSTVDPAEAAEEIDRLADEDQIIGLYANSAEADPPLGDPQHDVMYEAAEDHDMGFIFHSGVSSPHYPNLDHAVGKFLTMHTIGHPVSHMINLVSMMYEGVPEKFPDLNYVFVEAGIGWAAYLMARMNREVAQRKWEAPLLDKTPEEYIDDSFYFANQPIEEYNDPDKLRNTIDTLGAENLVFASDHPHFDFDYPSMTAKFYDHLSQEEQDQIFHGNMLDAFPRLDGQVSV